MATTAGRKGLKDLREKAEQSLRKSAPSLHKLPKRNILHLLQEMEVYQRELELQNDELHSSQLALRESQRRYAELYDFAPVGYLTFSREGLIEKANLAAARLLGKERRYVIHRALHLFMAKESRQTFYQFSTRLFEGARRESCELRLTPKIGPPLDVHMMGSAALEANGQPTSCRAALIDVTDRKKTEEQLRHSREELHVLAARLQAAHEAERIVLAREIHDELSGTLTALKMDLALLPDRMAKDQSLFFEKLNSMSELIDHTLAHVRSIVTELRPVVLDKLGLVAAVEWQAGAFQDRSGIACETHLPTEEIPLGPELSTALFRILQEALTNVSRHAAATKVIVDLTIDEGNLILTVRDNGKGIGDRAIDAHNSIGLLGMRERALSFGGKTDVTRLPGGGTLVSVSIPQHHASLSQ